VLLHKQRLEANDVLTYDRRAGSYLVTGKGRLILHERTPTAPAPTPAPAKAPDTAQPPALPFTRSEITFDKEMKARLDNASSAAKFQCQAEFSGDVTVKQVPVEDAVNAPEAALFGRDGSQLIASKLRLIFSPGKPGASSPVLDFRAFGGVHVRSGEHVVYCDNLGCLTQNGAINFPSAQNGTGAPQLDLKTGKTRIAPAVPRLFTDKGAAQPDSESRPKPAQPPVPR
jgi:hypothetical protein